MNKKGIFSLILFLLTMSLLSYALFAFFTSSNTITSSTNVGKHSVELLKSYSETEKQLFYFEEAGKMSVIRALISIVDNPTNGNDFYLKKQGTGLVVDDLVEEFEKRILENLKDYGVDYVLYFEDGFRLQGLGDYGVNEFVEFSDSNMTFNYSVKSLFSVELEFSFEDYERDLEKSEEIYDKCIPVSLECLEGEFIKEFPNYETVISENNNLFNVVVNTKKVVNYGWGEKEAVYNFMLDYS